MRRKVITTVVTFSTTTAAMKMEKTARESEFQGRLIPIPSEISAQCGPCSGIKRILFVVCNKAEIFENFRIFIVE